MTRLQFLDLLGSSFLYIFVTSMSSNSSGNSLLCHAASKTLWGDFLTTFSAPSSPYSGGPFRGCSRIRGGGAKKPPLSKICHTYPTMMKPQTQLSTLPKEDPENICITWHKSIVVLTSAFFQEQSQLYQEIQIQVAFSYLISNSFNFIEVFKDCFSKHGYDFDHVSKNGCSRSS